MSAHVVAEKVRRRFRGGRNADGGKNDDASSATNGNDIANGVAHSTNGHAADDSPVTSDCLHRPDGNDAESQKKEEEDEVEKPNMSFITCIVLLAVVTVVCELLPRASSLAD